MTPVSSAPPRLYQTTWRAALFLIGLKFQVVVMAIGIGIFLTAAVGWFVQAGRRHAAHGADEAHAAAGGTAHPAEPDAETP